MSDEGLFRSARGGVRVEREPVNEMQYLVTPPSTRLVPHHVGQQTGCDGAGEGNGPGHPSPGCESPSSNQKQNCRYRQPHLAREYWHAQNRGTLLRTQLNEN